MDKANAVIDAFVEAIKEALSENDEILVVGFGRFIKSKAEARSGINPKTGQPIKIAAYMKPRFKAGTKLKEACNENENPKSSKTNFKSHREVKISFMHDWLLTPIYPLKKYLKTCF